MKFQIAPDEQLYCEEHAIAIMAAAVGKRVPEIRLCETEDCGAHFMSRRFDLGAAGPLHLHSLAGLTPTPVRELIDLLGSP